MELVYEFTYQATLKPPLDVGGPYGQRMVVEVTGGELKGERVRGTFQTGGADWLLVGPDGFGRLDVRAQLITDDGVPIYVKYTVGILEMNEKVGAALTNATGTEYEDQYFRTSPQFETSHPKYAWLSQTVFVAEGRILPDRVVEYKVYRVA